MKREIFSKTGIPVIALGLNLIIGVTISAAATVTVCSSGCDYSVIQSAINNATAGDTIKIASGTYTEAGITVDKDLVLDGDGVGKTIVQAAAAEATASDRVFSISAGVTATLQDMSIRHGYPDSSQGGGAGILHLGTMLSINNCLITLNRFSSGFGLRGGGIYSKGHLTINNSSVSNNTGDAVEHDGGGIFMENAASDLVIRNSTISDNTDWNFGGGVLIYSANSATIINSTISGNEAMTGSNGGGIWNGSTTTISFCTISNNRVIGSGNGGGIYISSGSITIKNSIVAENTADSGSGPDLYGTVFTTLGGNLIGDNSNVAAVFPAGTVNANGDYVGTNASPVDPLLDSLADNGGPTQTIALLGLSPARDLAAQCTDTQNVAVTTDQRGYLRPTSDCDIGAYDHDGVGGANFLPWLHMVPIWKAAHDRTHGEQ